jgi:Tol biopolymer transport system component
LHKELTVKTSWYLVASSGPSSISAFQLVGPSITIGRAADNDIVLDDNMVSRHHARLEIQGDTYTLTDLGSVNGTWVNGRRISAPVSLQANDSIRFGKVSVFVFSAQPSVGGDKTFVAEVMAPERAPMPAAAPARPRSAAKGGLPGWFLAIGCVLVILIVVLVAALIVFLVLPSRTKSKPSVGVKPTLPQITAIPLGPTSTPMPTETSIPTFTAIPTVSPTLTPIPPTPTPGAWVQVMATAKAGPPIFGPDSGKLVHEEKGFVISKSAEGVTMRDFVVEAVFYNPYPTTRGDWDIGFLFRDTGTADELRLVVDSSGDWELGDRRGDGLNAVEKGRLSNLDTRDSGSNWLVLAADGDRGFFFVNGTFVAELDLSNRTESGKVLVATGIVTGHQIEGEVTTYDGFTVWPLTPQAKQVTVVVATDTPIAPTPPPSTSTPTVPPPTPTPRSAGVGQIAFVSNRDGNDEIYVMNPDGSNQRRLTNTPGEDWHPAWSPDGTKIVFQCMSGGTFNVCVVNADGSGYTQLINWTKDEGLAQRPVWSPDGGKIVVTRELGGGQKLVVMNSDGSNQTEIVNLGRDPSWSPDGTQIAFIRWEGGGLQIWTVSPDGSSERMLTQGNHDHMYPTWSPDGGQIAFEYDHAQVAVMDTGGGSPRVIANKGSYNLSWSPDGSKMVIAPSGEGLWLVNADGSGLTQIAQEGKQPSWQAVP